MYLHYAVFLPVDWHSSNSKEKKTEMRHFATALVLACVLSGTVSAGEIPTTGATTPQPSSSIVLSGDIPTTGETALQESMALTIILALLGIVP